MIKYENINKSYIDSYLLDGMRLEKTINYMWNNEKTGIFSKWIKLGLIEVNENDTSTIEGYRSKVSRGVDCSLIIHNPKNHKKLIIVREDTNLSKPRSSPWWENKVDKLVREKAARARKRKCPKVTRKLRDVVSITFL